MPKYAIDPEFEPLLPLLPTISDLSTLEKIQVIRAPRAEMFSGGADRSDVVTEDRTVRGPSGAPRSVPFLERHHAASR
jgi:hypothetical protein